MGWYEVACPGIGGESLVWETSKVRSGHDKKNTVNEITRSRCGLFHRACLGNLVKGIKTY